MFIRTQDNKDLVNLDRVTHIQVQRTSIYFNFGGEDDWILAGEYRNEKAALQILATIESIISNKHDIYVMPVEA